MTDADPSQHLTWREMLARVTEATGDRLTAKWLCEHASGCDGDEFASIANDLVSQRSGLHLDDMLRRLSAGEPLQYVMGRWAFRRLDLMVDRRVLIPRPETELLVEHVLAAVRSRAPRERGHLVIADLGTGSGAIGLSLLHELPPGGATVWMTDASTDAIDVARANAAGVGRAGLGARFAVGEWFDALPHELLGTFDAVVSNPPYVAVGDPALEHSVREWEPAMALLAGDDGLDALRVIIAGARRWLVPGGLLALEIGHDQGGAVVELMTAAGLVNATVTRDLAGHERFATAESPR